MKNQVLALKKEYILFSLEDLSLTFHVSFHLLSHLPWDNTDSIGSSCMDARADFFYIVNQQERENHREPPASTDIKDECPHHLKRLSTTGLREPQLQ